MAPLMLTAPSGGGLVRLVEEKFCILSHATLTETLNNL